MPPEQKLTVVKFQCMCCHHNEAEWTNAYFCDNTAVCGLDISIKVKMTLSDMFCQHVQRNRTLLCNVRFTFTTSNNVTAQNLISIQEHRHRWDNFQTELRKTYLWDEINSRFRCVPFLVQINNKKKDCFTAMKQHHWHAREYTRAEQLWNGFQKIWQVNRCSIYSALQIDAGRVKACALSLTSNSVSKKIYVTVW